MKNITVKRKFNISEYINITTGETLASELINNNSSLYKEQRTELVTVSSKEYMVIDSKAFQYIAKNLNIQDAFRTSQLADTLHTEFNMLYNTNNTPHTLDSISNLFGISIDEVRRLIKRLEKLSILGYLKGTKNGKSIRLYIMNPSVARKRKTFNSEIFKIFDDLTLKY